MEPHGPSQTTGESVNGNHTRESNFIKAEDLLADPAIPPLGTYCRGPVQGLQGMWIKMSQSLAHYNPKRGATQMLISIGVERHIAVYLYNEIQK